MKKIIHNQSEWMEYRLNESENYPFEPRIEPDYYPVMAIPYRAGGDILSFHFFYPLDARQLMRVAEEMRTERENLNWDRVSDNIRDQILKGNMGG